MTETKQYEPTLGIIAGSGDLPVEVAHRAQARGSRLYVIQLKGFEEPRLDAFPGETIGIGQLGRQVERLRAAGVERVVFAGKVQRPDWKSLKLDFRGARLLPRVMSAAKQGDDALMRVLVDFYEGEGFEVVGADDVASELVEAAGTLTDKQPATGDLQDIRRAAEVAAAIGGLDIGQGCVVCEGLVLAVEAQEGTDAMLARVATLPQPVRGTPDARRGVLVKRPKPIQERRIDLPTIGVRTVRNAAAAGLRGIALEAGGALIVDLVGTVAEADRQGLFIHIFPPETGRDR